MTYRITMNKLLSEDTLVMLHRVEDSRYLLHHCSTHRRRTAKLISGHVNAVQVTSGEPLLRLQPTALEPIPVRSMLY